MKNLVIIGAGGHGRVVADIAQKLNIYEKIAFLDDGNATDCMRLPIIGKSADFERYVSTSEMFVAIGNNKTRAEFLTKLFNMGAHVATLIHPSAIIGAHVEIGAGTAVMAGAVINPCAKIGKGCIVNTGSSVDHDCKIEDCCHIAVGAHLAGTVTVKRQTWIGAGATVSNNISICADSMIGAGAVVVKDITESGTYIGVPARLK